MIVQIVLSVGIFEERWASMGGNSFLIKCVFIWTQKEEIKAEYLNFEFHIARLPELCYYVGYCFILSEANIL